MKTYSKKIIGLLFSLMAVLCCAFTFLMIKPKVAHAANNTTFASVPGASVYIKTFEGFEDLDTNGIRFSFEIDQNTYENLVEEVDGVKVWKSGVSVMAYIVPETKLVDGYTADDVMSDTDTNSKPITADKWRLLDSEITKGTKVYTSYAYLYNLPPVAFDSTIVSCAKLTTTEDTMVTDVQTRSMRQVAQNALNADAYAYGSNNYKACLKYCETYTLTLGDTEYTAAYGVKLNGLPTPDAKAGVSGKWTINGEEITASTVWNKKNNATAIALYDATSTVKEIALCKYTYANDVASVKTMTNIVSAYNLGEVSAVYYADDLTTNLLDANGKVNVTNLANGQKQMVVVAEDTNFIVNTVVADCVFTNANQGIFSSVINSNLAGYYVLDENLTFKNGSKDVKITTIGKKSATQFEAFTGIFDGRGYAMKNVQLGGEGGSWWESNTESRCTVFANLRGTIKNVYVEYLAPNISSAYCVAFVGICYGTVENIYVKMTIRNTLSANSASAAIVAKLYYDINSKNELKNCVGEIELNGVSDTSGIVLASLVGTAYSGMPIKNCYGVTNGINYKNNSNCAQKINDGLCAYYSNNVTFPTSVERVDTRAGLLNKTFNSADGWLYWHKEADGLYFGTTKIVANS